MSHTSKPQATVTHILAFMVDYGRNYLASGGPTSRLEDALMILGRQQGYPTEIFATPTGIFVSVVDGHGSSHTTLSRIKESGVNLGRLCWLEGIFEDVADGKISVTQASKVMHSKAVHRSPYKLWQNLAASFVSGFALSLTGYSLGWAALASGLISTATWWVSSMALRDRISSGIFRDFVGAAATLVLAALAQMIVRAPFESLTIGGLVMLVPGLALTTAISELADQNLVSGTAKLMQAVLTLLAMGLAYLLFEDLSDALHLAAAPSAPQAPLGFVLSAFAVGVSVACWSILFKAPRKALPWSTLTGVLGWAVLKLFTTAQYVSAATFLAAFTVGLVSLAIGRRYRVPSQVFSVPGLIAMLPGMLALTSLRSFEAGEQSHGIDLGLRVALTAGSIAFGLFAARVPLTFIAEKKR